MIKEFVCPKCNTTFEKIYTRSEQRRYFDTYGKEICIECGHPDCQPCVSRVARAQFKGSGFHENDYGRK